MKFISFTVPCYNSESYMRKCIDSLLVLGEDAEIIIVNDGSKDSTGAIADEYAAKYPTICKPVHQENKGHGGGLNAGIREAEGLYLKIVDSDDWLAEDALKKLLETIKQHVAAGVEPDLYVTNFIYDHTLDNTRYVSHYRKYLKSNAFSDWSNMKKFHLWHLMLMHAFTYRTETLRKCGINLPEHTFYEDNYFAFMPLPHVKKLYYLDVDLYHYFIGRADQSVTVSNMVKRYAQQLRVMTLMATSYTCEELDALPKGLRKYMYHALKAVMSNTVFFTCGENTQERKDGLQTFYDTVKAHDVRMYKYVKHHSYASVTNWMPWGMRGKVTLFFYNLLCKIVKLG